MNRLKILFITNWYPTKEEPAKAVWAREHAKAVSRYDEVRVLHCVGTDLNMKKLWRTEAESNEDLREGIPTHRLWYRPWPIARLSYLIYVWSIFRTFQQIVKDGFLPDVIHVHIYDAGAPAILIGKLNHIPVVVTEQFSSFPRDLLGRLDLLKAWFAFRWANMVLPVSHALQKAIENYGLRAHFQVIPNVADTAIFQPPSGTREDKHPKRILYVGQLVPVKGVPYLLQALSRLSQSREDWHLDIVGDGPARTEYENLATELKLSAKIAFHGLKAKREVAEFMGRADLFVLPSLYETFSAPAIEALATGTPVVATRCGGPDDFVTKEVGLLVAAGDPEALCAGLDYMFDHLHLYPRKEISQYAAEHFSPEIVGAQLHAVYNSVRRYRIATVR